MQIGILGPLEVRDGERLIPIAGARLRRLLTRLALDAPAAVSLGALVEAVWTDDEPSEVANALQSLVSRLRRGLGVTTLVVQVPAGYRLDLPNDSVDAHAFAIEAVDGRRRLRAGDAAGAAEVLATALARWRGAPLADADDAGYVAAPVARLEEQRLGAIGDRIDAELLLGRPAEPIADLEELVADHPLREQFVGQLMRALAATGRTAEALTAYQGLRDRLADHLGVDPGPEIKALHLRILRGEVGDGPTNPAVGRRAGGTDQGGNGSAGGAGPSVSSVEGQEPRPSGRAARTNLRAAVSSFVGRQEELARIASLIEDGRLTTIVGPGGAGKTRLAVEAGRPWVDRCADGVWVVELAPVTDEATIAQAVLSALGLRDSRILERRGDSGFAMSARQRVLETLAEADALLVMDNCEHLIGGVAELVAEILELCPAVRVLATSREPLGIGGEALASIPPLGLPPVGATAEQAVRYPAVELLITRGRAASADFCLDEHTVGAVVEIVRRLDGLPLAIELAAARLRVLPVAEIAARLVDRFRLLAGGMRTAVARHRTLRAVVEWSWEILTDDERLLAERLAVFAAGATAEAAAAVCADEQLSAAEIPDLLIALVDKSLLDVVPQPSVRYRMLETIREYGVERLDERSELEAARSRHAEYYAKVTHRLAPVLRTADQLLALAELAAERDNILAALRFLGDSGDGAGTLRLVLDLGWYWNITGSHTEMLTWTEFALAVSEGIDSPDRTKMEAGQVLAALAGPMEEIGWEDMAGRMGAAAERLAEIDDLADPITWVVRLISAFFRAQSHEVDELIEAGRAAPDPWVRAVTASTHVMLLENLGELDGMRTEIQEAYDGFSAIGDRWGLSNILTARAAVRSVDGDVEGALADYRLALDYLAQLGATEDDLQIQLRMGSLALRRKDFATAREHIQQARSGDGDRPASRERTMMADIALLTVAMVEGAVDQAVDLAADIRRRMVGVPGNNMMFAHMASLAGAACAVSAIVTGDLGLARRDLAGAYPAGISSSDLPVLAVVGVAVATYADAAGRHADAAEILGAAATLRGYDDLSDPLIARVRDNAAAVIGAAAFDSAYVTGRALPKDAAPKRLDPVLLEEEPVGVSGRSKDAAREVIPDGI